MGAGNFLPAHAQVTTQHLARSAKGCQLQGWLLLGASYAAFLLPTSMRQLEPQTTVHSILLLNGAPTEHLDGRGGGSAHSLMSHCLGPDLFLGKGRRHPQDLALGHTGHSAFWFRKLFAVSPALLL